MNLKKVGTNIRRLRKAAGLTQEALAERMDITQGSICAWERGEKAPKLLSLFKMADVFDVDVREFFNEGL